MPAHGPIHLPLEEEDKNANDDSIATTTGVAFEVLRTAAIASALGLQVYSAVVAKRYLNDGKVERVLPDRTEIKLWGTLGAWQAQAGCGGCMVRRSTEVCSGQRACLTQITRLLRCPQAYTWRLCANVQLSGEQYKPCSTDCSSVCSR